MHIMEWLFQDLVIKGAQESCVEEHQRYRRPPKGINLNNWFVCLQRLKYGDFVSGNAFKESND